MGIQLIKGEQVQKFMHPINAARNTLDSFKTVADDVKEKDYGQAFQDAHALLDNGQDLYSSVSGLAKGDGTWKNTSDFIKDAFKNGVDESNPDAFAKDLQEAISSDLKGAANDKIDQGADDAKDKIHEGLDFLPDFIQTGAENVVNGFINGASYLGKGALDGINKILNH